jgi:penicillin-insensitive murein endopeptidase
MRKFFIALVFLSVFWQCNTPPNNKPTPQNLSIIPSFGEKQNQEVIQYYNQYKNLDTSSISQGTVNNGKLINGVIVPFYGNNFEYFDSKSYLAGRGFLHYKVLQSVLNCYAELHQKLPERKFYIMECSHQHGGKLHPHITHQNGLSIDFMVPKVKNNEAFYGLDSLGINHYSLEFNAKGEYQKDPSISIDFETMATHILTLQQHLLQNKLKIAKVIFKTELKEALFATKSGKILQKSNIYFTKSLTPLINSLHDDHYHIDFEFIK